MVILAAVSETFEPNHVIATGSDLARAFDDELVVVHVIPDEDADEHMAALREIPEYDDATLEDELERAREFAASAIRTERGSRSSKRPRAIGRVGEPSEQILDAAGELDARYVVIGGRKRSPVGKALFGSTAQSVLLNADRPVVMARGSPGASSP